MTDTAFRALLDRQGITGYRLWKTTGIPQSTLSSYKTGKKSLLNAPLSTSIRIAEGLGVTVDEVVKAVLEDEKNDNQDCL